MPVSGMFQSRLVRHAFVAGGIVGALIVISACESSAAPPGAIQVEASFGEIGNSPGQFQYPRAMTVIPAGVGGFDSPSLVVIDKSARVQRFDPESGRVLAGFRMPAWDLGKPTGLTVGPHPTDRSRQMLWIADTHYHRVLVYDIPTSISEGTQEPVLSFGEFGTDPGQFIFPTDVAIITNSDGTIDRVFVSEYGGNDRVTVFEINDANELHPVSTIGRMGNAGEDDADGSLVLHRPQDLEIDTQFGHLLIVDALNHRILRVGLDAEQRGTLIDAFGSPATVGRALGQLDHPYSLARLDDGSVLVSEFGSCRVQHLNLETGESLGSFGVPGRRVGELVNPWEIVVIQKRAWVLDSGNNRVVGFDSPAQGAERW